jgi:hypothetical protein
MFSKKLSRRIHHICKRYSCPKNGVLTMHYGIEEITVNVRKMLQKFYWIC